MNKYCFTVLFLFIGFSLMAQGPRKSKKSKQDDDKRWHEIELNSVFLLQEVFGARESGDLENAYLVGYKTGKGNFGLRFGLGAGFDLKTEKESLLEERNLLEYTIKARFGLEWRKDLMERWQLITGLDGVAESFFREDETKTTFDNIKTSDNEFAIGGGPVLGIRFWLNEKISLATETGLQALYIRKVESIESQNIPDFNSKKVSFDYPIRFNPPINLYLIIRL